MQVDRSIRRVLYVMIAIGTVAGLVAAGQRYRVEQRNRSVEVAIDLTEARTLAAATHQPLAEVLARFRAAGVTSVAIPEDTFASLETEGKLQSQRDGIATTVAVYSSELLNRIAAALAARGYPTTWDSLEGLDDVSSGLTNFALRMELKEGEDVHRKHYRVFVSADYGILRTLGIGLDPELVSEVKTAGLIPVARLSNFPGSTPQAMTNVLAGLRDLGVRTVVFQGLDVLGYRGQTADAADALRKTGIQYGQIEFGKQRGDDALGRMLHGDFIRVHSISDSEIGSMDETEAIDRFVRAARERNIRLCFVRMLSFAGADPVGYNVNYIHKITRGIARGHEMSLGPAHPFEDPGVSRILFALIALGVAAGAALLLVRAFPLAAPSAYALTAVLAVLCMAAAAAGGEMGRRLVALLAALVFPTLACLRRAILDPESVASGWRAAALRERALSPGASTREALRGLAGASGVTALGAVAVVGLLASLPFMMKVNQFLGIKVSLALPVLLIAAIAVTGLPRPGRTWREERERIRRRVSEFLSQPFGVGALILSIVALAALALAVARSGNDPGIGVSGIELRLRDLLDAILPVRPRTKEFLVGHPAFVLALALWYRGKRRWVVPLLIVGVIGQVSLLNTFCHIHTPLWLSFIRALTGLVIGGALGVVVFRVVDWLWAGAPPASEAGRGAAVPAQPHA